MYEHFNPFGLGDAWWQHLLMLVVAGILGYIIGYISGKNRVDTLESELLALDVDLDECTKSKNAMMAAVAVPVVKTVQAKAFAAPTPAPVIIPDDLKIVEGIGPKIEQLLNKEGILTYAQLALTSPDRIREILVAAGTRFQMHDPTTWPTQSAMARDGKWEELKVWQDELNKGRTE